MSPDGIAATVVAVGIAGAGGCVWLCRFVWRFLLAQAHIAAAAAIASSDRAQADAIAAAVEEAHDGDRRLHERIDDMVKETQLRIEALRDEAKEDRHDLVDRVQKIISADRLERDAFRDRIYTELRGLGERLAAIRGMLHARLPPQPGDGDAR